MYFMLFAFEPCGDIMLNFFKKPYVYTVCISILLAGLLTWSLLDVFIIKKTMESSEMETMDFSKFTVAQSPNTLPPLEPWPMDPLPSETQSHGTDGSVITLAPSENESMNEPSGSEDVTAPPSAESEETPAPPAVEYPIITENSYADENIRIQITTIRRFDSDIHVAEVRLSSLSYLKTAFANDEFGLNIKEKTSSQAERVGAIFAVNGDYYGANKEGYVIRNGILYRDSIRNSKFDDLAILYDGSFISFYERDVALRDLLHKQGAMQVLAFGPTLLKDGEIAVDTDTEVGVAHHTAGNPRTVIGIVEPLHYFFVVADGRTAESFGPTLHQMAQIMQELGCTMAYNLDGGGSATMYFNGKVINRPTTDGDIHERSVSDIVYIGY